MVFLGFLSQVSLPSLQSPNTFCFSPPSPQRQIVIIIVSAQLSWLVHTCTHCGTNTLWQYPFLRGCLFGIITLAGPISPDMGSVPSDMATLRVWRSCFDSWSCFSLSFELSAFSWFARSIWASTAWRTEPQLLHLGGEMHGEMMKTWNFDENVKF